MDVDGRGRTLLFSAKRRNIAQNVAAAINQHEIKVSLLSSFCCLTVLFIAKV